MKKFIIIAIVIVILAAAAVAFMVFTHQPSSNGGTLPAGTSTAVTGSGGVNGGTTGGTTTGTAGQSDTGGSGAVTAPTSSISDYFGTVSQVFGTSYPQGQTFTIGTSAGLVTVNNFYSPTTPVTVDQNLIIQSTADHFVSYDPTTGAFWIAITAQPFDTYRASAEASLVSLLGVNQTDACKLRITEGVVYAPGNPEDGVSLPLSFCGSSAGSGAGSGSSGFSQ